MTEQALATTQEIPHITSEDLKKYFAPNATDKEFFLFTQTCNHLQLDPVKREVHFVKYGDSPGQTIVGYQVYVARAEDTGQLDGWNVTVVDEGKPTEKAVVTIYRKDRTHPIVWEVKRSEFDRHQSTWKVMPSFMLRKVAIAQGFRLAFPKQLGGLPYIAEELPQTSKTTSEQLTNGNAPEPEEPLIPDEVLEPDKPMMASEKQIKGVFALAKEVGLTPAMLKVKCHEIMIDKETSAEWTAQEVAAITKMLEGLK